MNIKIYTCDDILGRHYYHHFFWINTALLPSFHEVNAELQILAFRNSRDTSDTRISIRMHQFGQNGKIYSKKTVLYSIQLPISLMINVVLPQIMLRN